MTIAKEYFPASIRRRPDYKLLWRWLKPRQKQTFIKDGHFCVRGSHGGYYRLSGKVRLFGEESYIREGHFVSCRISKNKIKNRGLHRLGLPSYLLPRAIAIRSIHKNVKALKCDYCVRVGGYGHYFPLFDKLLAIKVTLETDEYSFLKTANLISITWVS